MQRWNDTTLSALVLGGNTHIVEVPLDAKAGEVYYFRFSTGVGAPVYNGVSLTWRLEQVPSDVGTVEILQTKYQSDKR